MSGDMLQYTFGVYSTVYGMQAVRVSRTLTGTFKADVKCSECGEVFRRRGVKQHWHNAHDDVIPRPWWPPKEEAEDRGKWWEYQRRRALERDGEKCRVCGITDDECREEGVMGVHVHHIRPVEDFEDSEFPHSLCNLVSACPQCHKDLERLPEAEQRDLIETGGER